MNLSSYSYKDQLDVLKNLKLSEGESIRMDCPFCYGKNTFGIRKADGFITWHCFRMSCAVMGRKQYGISIDVAKAKLLPNSSTKVGGIPIPNPLTSIRRHSDFMAWLETNHCMEAMESGLVDIQYSPTEDRIMFGVKHGASSLGYIGRSLSQRPKWKKYGDTTHLFTCGNSRHGIVVEDAPSACAAGVVRGFAGIALLGTALTAQHKVELGCYSTLLICLDPDAARKGLDMVRALSGVTDARLRLINDDLKYYAPHEISSMLGIE